MTTPAYNFRFVKDAERAEIGKRVTTPPAPPVPDEAMQTAWERDLAAHMALRDATTDSAERASHDEAIQTLISALNKAAPRTK